MDKPNDDDIKMLTQQMDVYASDFQKVISRYYDVKKRYAVLEASHKGLLNIHKIENYKEESVSEFCLVIDRNGKILGSDNESMEIINLGATRNNNLFDWLKESDHDRFNLLLNNSSLKSAFLDRFYSLECNLRAGSDPMTVEFFPLSFHECGQIRYCVVGKIYAGYNQSFIHHQIIIDESTCYLSTNGPRIEQFRHSLLKNGTVQRYSCDGIPLNIDFTRFGFFTLDELLDHVRLRGSWTGDVLIEINSENTEQRSLSIHRVSDSAADEIGFILIVKQITVKDDPVIFDCASIDILTGLYKTKVFEDIVMQRSKFAFNRNLRTYILVIATSIDTSIFPLDREKISGDVQYRLAQRIEKAIRGCDVATYLGELGFAVNINNIKEDEEFEDILKNIKKYLDLTIDVEGRTFPVIAKFGQVEINTVDLSVSKILMQAWDKLY